MLSFNRAKGANDMKTVYVTDFGVKADAGLQTVGFQSAIDEVYRAGGGTVIVPAGDYTVGDIRLRSGIRLYLEKNAHLCGSRDPEEYAHILEDASEPLADSDRTDVRWIPMAKRPKDFSGYNMKPGSRWNHGIIRAVDAVNIAIYGEEGAWIDGCDCFDETGEEFYRGPHAINFHRCKNVVLSGYTVKNSANWAHALFDCTNITVKNVCVEAGHDGIHLTSCHNTTVTDCEFYTGDDCVAGIDNRNVSVKNCVLNTACSAFRFGGTNVMIDGCRIEGPAKYLFRGSLSEEEKRTGAKPNMTHRHNMLSAFTYYADFTRKIEGSPANIIVQNCTVENADRFLHYNYSGNEPWQRNKPLESILFRNVTAKGIRNPLTAYGDPERKVRLTLSDCRIRFADDRGEAPFMHLCHFDKVILENTAVENVRGDVLIKSWSKDDNLILRNFCASGFETPGVTYTEEKFVCKAI